MSPPSRERVAALFGELAELAPGARAARLAALERDDPALGGELRSLLAADAAAGDFLGVLADPSGATWPRPAADAGTCGPVAPGARVGPYRVLRRLGSGGMATVWLAEDARLGRRVALKFLRHAWDDAPAPDARERFVAEARAAARLDHPHVAAVHDVGETADGRPYIAMAHCEGGSLADRLAAGRLPAADAARVAAQIADALDAAHGAGIVHRDVKPANVLFDAAGNVRLADFGIAKLAGGDATRSGVVLGTASYLAPEQLGGGAVDHRADLWALGVTLYEMLAGRRPFAGSSHAALLHAIVAAQPEPLGAVAPDVPPALAALAHRLLAKRPEERPASAAEARRALAAALHEPPERAGGARLPPAPLTPLVGRERELALAAELLARGRLVTLTGTGGTGKTRLALELARVLADRYPDGVHVVALAGVGAADRVPGAVAQAVAGECAARGPDEAARLHLARGRALLVLDNFEHLLGAAPFVAGLLADAPGLTVLVTSREPLRLRGEQELPVPPLEVPAGTAWTAAAACASPAVRLFAQRARAARPDFALTDENAPDVVAVCRRVDGLPLALELAAARVRVLSPRALHARLRERLDLLRSDARDVEPRHRTLRDVVDWSYGLLAPGEQALFRALGVFAGGFALDAAAAVAPAPDAADVLDGVASLADKGLVARGDREDDEPRFHLLEVLREYALARLREAGEEPRARAAHRAHFLALAEEGARHLRGPGQAAWLDRLEEEHDNLRAALAHAEADGDWPAAARLCVALHRFWIVTRSHIAEAHARIAAVEARLRADPAVALPPGTRARLLVALGLVAAVRSELRAAHGWLEEALAAHRADGDAPGEAATLNHLGWSWYSFGDYAAAEAVTRRALALHRAHGDARGVAVSHVNLGWVAAARGALDDARRCFDAALADARRAGDERLAAGVVSYLGALAQRRGDHARAVALYEAAIDGIQHVADRWLVPVTLARLASARHEQGLDGAAELIAARVLPPLREIGQPWSLGPALARLAAIQLDRGDLEAARAAVEESLALGREMGAPADVAEGEALLAEVERRDGRRGRAAALWRASLRDRHARGDAIGVAECVEGIARLALDADDAEAAAVLLAGAAAARDRLGAPLAPRHREADAARRAAVAARLGADAFRAACAAGAALPADALVARALAALG